MNWVVVLYAYHKAPWLTLSNPLTHTTVITYSILQKKVLVIMNAEKLSYIYPFDFPRSYMKILSSFTSLLVYCIVRLLLYFRKKMNKEGVRIKLIIIPYKLHKENYILKFSHSHTSTQAAIHPSIAARVAEKKRESSLSKLSFILIIY